MSRPPFALCYHGLGRPRPGSDPHGLLLDPSLFAAQLDDLQARGHRLVTASELWDGVRDGAGRDLGAITFDDGLADTMRAAVALLADRGARATLYVPTGLLGGPHPDLGEGERILDRAGVAEIAAAGIEIGAHTVDHVDLRTLPYDAALDQLRRNKAELEDITGRPVRSLAYPYGSFGPGAMRAAEAAGFDSAWGCSGPAPWRAFGLPREPVFPSTGIRRLRLKAAGRYGPVHRAARLRARLRR
jgi:peptidoglycan/xylan/chitin deacetylase (PgdA/CDA1 family)